MDADQGMQRKRGFLDRCGGGGNKWRGEGVHKEVDTERYKHTGLWSYLVPSETGAYESTRGPPF